MIVERIEDAAFGSDEALLPVVIRDATAGTVLTLAWANQEALRRTLESRETWLWSRSRSRLWNKGAESGNRQHVVRVSTDCDRDALLYDVQPAGPACHTGESSCFDDNPADILSLRALRQVLEQRRAERPAESYSTYLFNSGLDKILKKVGEEATEVVVAAKNDDDERLVEEVADLVFHLSVLLVERGIPLESVGAELRRRSGVSK